MFAYSDYLNIYKKTPINQYYPNNKKPVDSLVIEIYWLLYIIRFLRQSRLTAF